MKYYLDGSRPSYVLPSHSLSPSIAADFAFTFYLGASPFLCSPFFPFTLSPPLSMFFPYREAIPSNPSEERGGALYAPQWGPVRDSDWCRQ